MRDYQTKSNVGGVADSISATRFGGGEFNSIAVELENAVESSDQTLAPADGTGEVSNQLAMAMAIYGAGGGQYMIDTGAANAYVLDPVSPKVAAPALFDGYTITFVPGNVNTGASTVNVNSIGAKSITMSDGSAIAAGVIDGLTSIRYDLSNDRFELLESAVAYTMSIITASGTYNPPAGARALEFTAIGGGGGGGGTDGQGAGTAVSSTAGGGGGASIKTTRIIESSYTIVIGAGGTGGAAGNNNGTTGGTTTITSTNVNLSVTGGQLGVGRTGGSVLSGQSGRAGGSGSGGDINIDGNPSGSALISGGDVFVGSYSGYSLLLGEVIPSVGNNGTNAVNFGAGGGSSTSVDATTDYAGGDGADGVVIVKEYY